MHLTNHLRRLILSGSLIATLAVPAAAYADAGTTPGVLARGGSVSGSVTNQLNGPQAMSYLLNGDGSSITLSATFSNVGDPTLNQAAFVNVFGPVGQVAQANPNVSAGSATVVFPTTAGQAYTVQVIAYPPIPQSKYTVSAN